MPHKPHYGDTGAEAQRVFEGLFDALGEPKTDNDYWRRVNGVKIDGVLLGDMPMELVGPDSNYYAKEYLEALAAARMLVQLDLDDGAEIIRRDKPDVKVRLKAGTIFVEVRMVGEEHVISMPRHVEQANIMLLDRRRSDPTFDKLLDGWTVCVRVGLVLQEERHTVDALANEVETFIRNIAGTKMLGPIEDAARYPLLTRYRSIANSRDVIFKTHTMIECGEVSHGAPPVLDLMREAVAEKEGKVRGYDPACTPLWLLLSVADERHFPPFLYKDLKNGLARETGSPFEKIVIIHAGMAPVVLD